LRGTGGFLGRTADYVLNQLVNNMTKGGDYPGIYNVKKVSRADLGSHGGWICIVNSSIRVHISRCLTSQRGGDITTHTTQPQNYLK